MFRRHGSEEVLLRRSLEIDEHGVELVFGIVELGQTLLQLMLKGGLADAPVAVEQNAVVVDSSQDVVQQPLAAKEALFFQNRSAGDIGVETPPQQPLAVACPQADEADAKGRQDRCKRGREPERANERDNVSRPSSPRSLSCLRCRPQPSRSSKRQPGCDTET